MRDQGIGDDLVWRAKPRSRPRRWRSALVAVGALLCMAATFSAGQEMARWRLHRVNTPDDAFAVGDDAPLDVRRKALVAMQREARRSIERIRLLSHDHEPSLAADAQRALDTIEESLR